MRWETHILFAIFIGVAGVWYGYFEPNIALLVGLLLGAFLPDIDCVSSKIGRRTRPLSDIIQKLLGHRGATHSLTGLFVFVIIIGLISTAVARGVFMPFFLGYLSHIIIDGLTPRGVYPLYPVKIKIAGPIKTDSWGERAFFTLILFLSLYLFYFS